MAERMPTLDNDGTTEPSIQIYQNNVRVGTERFAFPHSPTDALPNGAIILAERNVHIEQDDQGAVIPRRISHVLCVRPNIYEPYCFWTREVAVARTATGGWFLIDQTFWGHYFRDLTQAVSQFNKVRP